MELRPPRSPSLLLPACFSALLIFVIASVSWHVLEAALHGEPSPELMVLPMLLAMLWVFQAGKGPRWRLVADDTGIALKQGSHVHYIAWEQVDVCREEASPLERDGASWVTLRDEGGEVLLRWERSWFGRSKRSLREFDSFTAFVRQKIAEK